MAKSSKYKDLSQNAILFTISSFGSKLISFFLVPLYTYVLSTDDYGTLDLISTTVQLLIPVLTLNIQDAVLRFSLDKKYNSRNVMGAAVKVIGASSLLLAAALLLLKMSCIVTLDNQYLYYLFLTYSFGVLQNCLSMYLKATNQVKILTVSGLTHALLTCVLNLIFLLYFKMGVTGYLIANITGTVISVLFMFFAGKVYKVRFGQSRELLKQMIPYSLPLVANSLAWWVNNASDRYILTYFCGAALNGIYAVSYKIPTILSTIQSVLYNAWSISAITEFDKDDTDGFIGNIYSLYSAVSFVGCSVLLAGNIFIAKILYSNDFFSAWNYVPPLLVGTVFNGVALFEGCIFTAVKRTKDVSKTTLIGALVNTALNFALIPLCGALGAAIATMVGYISTWIMRTLQLRGIVKMKIKWSNQIACIILLLIQSVIALFRNIYWLQIPFMTLILFTQRKYFFKIWEVIKTKIKRK